MQVIAKFSPYNLLRKADRGVSADAHGEDFCFTLKNRLNLSGSVFRLLRGVRRNRSKPWLGSRKFKNSWRMKQKSSLVQISATVWPAIRSSQKIIGTSFISSLMRIYIFQLWILRSYLQNIIFFFLFRL